MLCTVKGIPLTSLSPPPPLLISLPPLLINPGPSPSIKRSYCFEVVNPKTTFVLQAENQSEKERYAQSPPRSDSTALSYATRWIKELQHGIAEALRSDAVPVREQHRARVGRAIKATTL